MSSNEEISKQVLNILRERGKKALELAKKTMLEEKIESKEVQEAIKYFMTEHWDDFSRPALLSLFCEAVGGNPDITTPISISITLISGAFAIHDDIIDQSKKKHSKPTVFKKFGKDIALLVGDALMVKGFSLLYKLVQKGVSVEQLAIISDIIKRTYFELGDAEALQLQFRGRIDVTPEEYLQVVRKEAADMEGHARIGAIVGGGSIEEIEALGEYSRLLGMLTILRSDMIDMLDLEMAIHRIKKEHIPLTLLFALKKSEMESIIGLLQKKTLTNNDAGKLLMFVDKAGGFIQMEECMNKLAEEAYSKLEKVKYNKNILKLFILSQLLPDWRDYLSYAEARNNSI